MIKAIVFDLDGTLMDQEAAERAALEKLYREDIHLDPSVNFKDFLRLWRKLAEDYITEFLKGRMTLEQQRIRRTMDVHSHFGREISQAQALEISLKYVAYYEQEWRLFPDTVIALSSLKPHYRLGIITNGESSQQRGKIQRCKIEGFFESILVSSEAPAPKPEKPIFEQSRNAFKLAPEEMAYVGDRIETDAIGARNAGWRGIWLDRKGMPGTAEQDTISGLLELAEKLK